VPTPAPQGWPEMAIAEGSRPGAGSRALVFPRNPPQLLLRALGRGSRPIKECFSELRQLLPVRGSRGGQADAPIRILRDYPQCSASLVDQTASGSSAWGLPGSFFT